ncbi:MAG TPA: type II toxin-antitoxin system HicB family antitoxin [Chthoniobacterales bacterium]
MSRVPETSEKRATATLTAVLEPAEEGGFTVRLKEFPEVVSQGENEQDALNNLIDALSLYLSCKTSSELQAGHVRKTITDALELQMA